MNKLLHLVFLDFKLLAKSKSFYLRLILFPTVMILILGTVFGNSNSKLPSFDVAFYSDDSSLPSDNGSISLGVTLEDKVLKSKDVESMINLKEMTSYDEGNSLVNEGKVSVFVYIPKDFTRALVNDTTSNITIIGNKNTTIDKTIIKDILDGFVLDTKTVFIEEKEAMQQLSLSTPLSKDVIEKIMNHIGSQETNSTIISKIQTDTHADPIDAMQYYSIAMIVMFSIITGFTLIHGIVDEKLNNTLFRIKSTPTLNIQYALGKLIGIIFAVVLQMILVIIITSLVFSMKWGNVFEILLITVVYAFSIGTMIFLCGLIAKDQSSVSSMSAPIGYGFSFLGGSFISKDALPDSLKFVQQIIPNGKAINSYLAICQGKGIGTIYMDLLELILIGVVFLVIALRVYNGRGSIHNANSNNDKTTVKATV